VGAVMVLFLFVVMMINLNMEGLRQGFWKHFPLAALIGVVIALEMAYVLLGGFRDVPRLATAGAHAATQVSNTQALGYLLYTRYLYPLEIAAVILVVAIVAAIALTLRRRKDTKFIDPSDQVRVRAQDRVSLVKVAATRAAPPPAPPVAEAAAAVEKKA
jgi:NADH-quinone oxidoreductase subunit J